MSLTILKRGRSSSITSSLLPDAYSSRHSLNIVSSGARVAGTAWGCTCRDLRRSGRISGSLRNKTNLLKRVWLSSKTGRLHTCTSPTLRFPRLHPAYGVRGLRRPKRGRHVPAVRRTGNLAFFMAYRHPALMSHSHLTSLRLDLVVTCCVKPTVGTNTGAGWFCGGGVLPASFASDRLV